ncbi:MAG: MBL fold metallo-hydrolase [Longimicrobiales bacterium]
MKVIVLGSGSEGNSTVVQANGVSVMIDAGFSGRDLERRLADSGVEPGSLQAIVITHDHGDHSRGMGILARRFGIPLYLTDRTRVACRDLLNGREDLRAYRSSEPFRVGPFEVEPFLTVHDAVDPVAITVKHVDSGSKMGVATDLGRPTAAVRARLAGSHVLILEANHDEAMLWNGPYPWSVKQRIAGSHGHLSNRAAADLMRELHHPGLCAVVLAHISVHANDRELARSVTEDALQRVRYRGVLQVARQDQPLEPLDVMALRRQHAGGEQLSFL